MIPHLSYHVKCYAALLGGHMLLLDGPHNPPEKRIDCPGGMDMVMGFVWVGMLVLSVIA